MNAHGGFARRVQVDRCHLDASADKDGKDLWWAAFYGQVDVVTRYLDNGSKVDVIGGNNKSTPLICSVGVLLCNCSVRAKSRISPTQPHATLPQ